MIEYPEHCVDFDFGPNGRTDGFDAWRLYNYACESPEKYAKYTNVATVESELNQYIQEDMVKKIDNFTSNLYFLRNPKRPINLTFRFSLLKIQSLLNFIGALTTSLKIHGLARRQH
ncbi:hypothetical protein LOY38_11445 [Pseudomonas sp. B21-015]|nr:hypothetical protein [Pseudomonas sp. B21-015]UVM52597.1 hypothetical protein LOY38_11445 [Pseudomonas sp. B21-015]